MDRIVTTIRKCILCKQYVKRKDIFCHYIGFMCLKCRNETITRLNKKHDKPEMDIKIKPISYYCKIDDTILKKVLLELQDGSN